MMSGLGYPLNPGGVARVYEGLISSLIIDAADADAASSVEALGVRVILANTIMRDEEARRALGVVALEAAGVKT
jgi:hypothetical protein